MRESILIDAAPMDVWPEIADLHRMAMWNPKIVSVSPGNTPDSARVVFRMNGKERPFETVVETEVPGELLVLRYTDPDGRSVRETFKLAADVSGGTRVEHDLDLSAAGIPWYFRGLIWFIGRFGEPQGDGPLEGLKRLVERAGSKPNPPVHSRVS